MYPKSHTPHGSTPLLLCLFIALFLSNGFLAYGVGPVHLKGFVFLLGVLLPLYLFFRVPPIEEGAPTLPTFPPQLYLLLGALVLLTRLSFLTTYRTFPGGDEGLHGFLAQGLIPDWNWTFFYTCAEHPPLLIWSIALPLRWTNNPIFSIWIVPAIFSILGWLFLTAAARRLFPPSQAFLLSFLFALSFWPLYSSRFCHQGPLLAPFLGALVYCLCRIETASGRGRALWSSLAGFCLGLGMLTFTAWLVVLPLTFAFVSYRVWALRKSSSPFILASAFTLGFLLGAAPFILAVFREGYGQHLYSVSTLGSWTEETHKRLVGASYITSVFWGGLLPTGDYGPPMGGLPFDGCLNLSIFGC
jgi:hypothetical protein